MLGRPASPFQVRFTSRAGGASARACHGPGPRAFKLTSARLGQDSGIRAPRRRRRRRVGRLGRCGGCRRRDGGIRDSKLCAAAGAQPASCSGPGRTKGSSRLGPASGRPMRTSGMTAACTRGQGRCLVAEPCTGTVFIKRTRRQRRRRLATWLVGNVVLRWMHFRWQWKSVTRVGVLG